MATASSIAASMASKTKTKKKHFVAQKVKLFRASDPLLSVLMWGVNHSINELSHIQIPIMLMPDDFKAYSKIKVDNHLFNKENMPSHFKFKEYCPLVFRNLRERFSIDDQDFQVRLQSSVHCPTIKISKSKINVFSTLSYIKSDLILQDIIRMSSLISNVSFCSPTFLFCMSLFYCHLLAGHGQIIFSSLQTDFYLFYFFNQWISILKCDKINTTKELPTYKDNDFINDGQKIYIDEDNKKMFLDKLKKDVEFLAQLKLMDYSLLVGIHDVERAEQEEVESEDNEGEEEGESDGGAVGTPPDSPSNTLDSTRPLGPGEFDPTIDVYAIKSHDNSPRKEVYFMAVIDILTHYDAKKKAAHAAKTVKHGAGAEISTVNPEQYSKRFYEFIATILS
ncbi:phosphatidylinositol 5-phosphate 4-kinase type-2 alpha isoform X2 [Arapaima gigas]